MRRALPGLVALCLAGCLQLEDFADQSLIDRPRVLAIIAEPPEIRPGEETRLAVLVVGASEVRVTWRACGSFDSVFGGGGAQFGEGDEDEGCGGDFAVPLPSSEDGTSVVLPGELTRDLFENLKLAEVIFGNDVPPDTVERIRERVGLPFIVEATVIADGKRIRAIKRVLISERAIPHRNPPPPRFAFGDTDVRGDLAMPGVCTTVDGETPTLAVASEVELVPFVDGEDEQEAWIESYEVIDARGELQPRTERAYYSWFSTAGDFESSVTKSPLRNQLWDAPREPGCESLWLVVRDGHGGTSACELRVAIGDATACE